MLAAFAGRSFTNAGKKKENTMNFKRPIQQATFLLAALLASLTLAGAARAQDVSPQFVGKFTLTSTVHWGKGTLPPGNYTLRIESAPSSHIMATIRSENYTVAIRVMSLAFGDYHGGLNALQLKTRNGQAVVQSLVLADLKMVLVFDPSPAHERIEEARADSAVVLVARK
jgi:hypothetical protein